MDRNDILNIWVTFMPPRQYSKQHYPPEPKRLKEVLVGRLQRHPKYCDLNAKCREQAAHGDESGSLATKRMLPTWLVGRWTGTGQKEQLVTFEPFMWFDIDASHNKGVSVDEMKRRVSMIPSVAVCAVSARGQGVYGLVYVPDKAMDEKVLQGHFRAFSRALKDVGLQGDEQCKNINRGRYLSIDPEPFISEDCTVFTDWLPEPRPTPTRASHPVASPEHMIERDGGGEHNWRRVLKMVEQCERLSIDPFPDADSWRNMGRSLAAMYGERGLEPFIRWSNLWSSLTGLEHDKDPHLVYAELSGQCSRFKNLNIIFDRCERVGIYGSERRKNNV